MLCISGLIGKPADFALKRLNPVVVAQTHVFENAGTLIEVEIAVAVLPMVYVEQAALFVVLQKVGCYTHVFGKLADVVVCTRRFRLLH